MILHSIWTAKTRLSRQPGISALMDDETPRQQRGGFWRRLFGATPEERLPELNEAIAQYPDAPANYVLRGELLLAIGRQDEAHADFEQALELAQEQLANAAWGLAEQAIADRARENLRRLREPNE